nr:phosphotransferase [uncultured Oscillibacter sp.]
MTGAPLEDLPDRLSLAYETEACLSSREGRSVWRMRRRADGEPFVLKLSLEGTEDLAEEFQLLKRLARRLPGAVPAPVDYFREDGTDYLLRAWLPGETLEQYRLRTGGCGAGRCAEIGRKLCALLGALHGLDPPIIHRDVKPENIILLPDGGVGLIDFGIARQYKPEQDRDTRHLGTRSTAAPEQYGYAQTDCRTDLYGLGMTLIWLLTGDYDRDGLDQAPRVPRRLGQVLKKAASFAPKDRYQNAADFSAALAGPGRRKWLLLLPLLLALAAGLCLRAWGTGSREVPFASRSLELAVRAELNRPSGPIVYRDLEQIERLAVVGTVPFSREEDFDYRIACYIGRDYQGDAPWGDASDLSLLARMPNLRELYLCRQGIEDLSPLEGLPLTALALCENRISDLTPLAGMTGLETLYLGGNPIADCGPLSGLTGLRLLNLDGTVTGPAAPESLGFLNGLALRELSLGRVLPRDGDWSPLAVQTGLETLSLWEPPKTALGEAASLNRLRVLKIGNITCPDLTPLSGLEHLEVLSVYSGLERLDGIGGMKRLLTLSLGQSEVSDLTPLKELESLNWLHLTEVAVKDFSPLAEMPALNDVLVDGDQVEAVEAACPGHGFRLERNG